MDGERKLGQNAGPAVETVGGVCVGVTGVAGGFAVAFNRLKLKGCKFANVIKCAQRAKRAHVNPRAAFGSTVCGRTVQRSLCSLCGKRFQYQVNTNASRRDRKKCQLKKKKIGDFFFPSESGTIIPEIPEQDV